MEIVNTYSDNLSYYSSKLRYVQEELDAASRIFQELIASTQESWRSKAGSACEEKLEELKRRLSEPSDAIDRACSDLDALDNAIMEELRRIAEEEEKARKEAEAAAAAAAVAAAVEVAGI